MLIKDRININDSQRKYTDEGFLVVPARIARTGIQEYLALEMGLEDRDPMDVIKVYRPESEVFSDVALSSFSNKVVTDNHPTELVSADNAKEYQIGFSGPEVTKDGIYAKTTLFITSSDAIKKIEDGKVELSNGYQSDIEWSPGVTPDGDKYDAIQRNIRGNHIALVDNGRCGPACKVSDNLPNDNSEEPNMGKITIDGVDFDASEQVAQAVGKLQQRALDAEKKAEDAEEALKEKEDEMEKKDKENKASNDSLQAKLDDAESKVPTPEMLDALVANRMATRDAALLINPEYKYDNKDCEQIRKEVVADACPDIDIEAVSADYIRARFDALATSKQGSNPITDGIKTQMDKGGDDKSTGNPVADARQQMIERNRNAWKKGAN